MAERLEGSEILRLANKVRELNAAGNAIANYTVGDFMPGEFGIPDALRDAIVQAYMNGLTNYPPSMGMPELKKAICKYMHDFHQLTYAPEETMISGGARPVIFLTYASVVNPGEKAIFPVPSWNNNHYCKLLGIQPVPVEVSAKHNFLPDVDTIKPHLKDAYLLTLTSPLNPTGTMFSKEALSGICEALLEENTQRQQQGRRPCYLLYDQMYSLLAFDRPHYIPTQLYPELRPWMIVADGASKWLAGTGIRVGWACGPKDLMMVMGNMLAHVGAWAPKPEQIGVSAMLNDTDATRSAVAALKDRVHDRLNRIFHAIMAMKAKGLKIDAIEPQGAMYLSVHIPLNGITLASGKTLNTNFEIADWLLEEGSLALVPFQAFGVPAENGWFRLSIGGVTESDIQNSMMSLERLLLQVS
jgi:aspartate aminotransferase